MKTGDLITIHAHDSYADGVIADLRTIDELPDIEQLGALSEAAKEILRESNFLRVLIVDYDFLDQVLRCVLFETRPNEWIDLRGQQIIIEPRTAENASAEIPRKKPGIVWRNPRRLRSSIDWSKF